MLRERIAQLRELPRHDKHFVGKIATFEDATSLILNSIEAPEHVRFGIFHGISDNYWKSYDISNAREVLGYAPKDDAFALAGISQEPKAR